MSSPEPSPEKKAASDHINGITLICSLGLMIVGSALRTVTGLPLWAATLLSVPVCFTLAWAAYFLLTRKKLRTITMLCFVASAAATYLVWLFLIVGLLFAIGGHDWTKHIGEDRWQTYILFLGAGGMTALLSWPIFRFWRKTILRYCA